MMTGNSRESIEGRLFRLESEHRKTRRCNAFLKVSLLALIAGMMIGARKSADDDVVVATSFLLVDKDSKPRLAINVSERGPGISIYNASGDSLVELRSRDDGTSDLSLMAPPQPGQGKAMAQLAILNKCPLFQMTRDNNQPRSQIVQIVQGDGTASIELNNTLGQKRVLMGFDAASAPSVKLFDAQERIVDSLPAGR